MSYIVSKIIFALENILFTFNVSDFKKINVYYNLKKKKVLSLQGGLVDRGACHHAHWPEFNPHDPCKSGRRETTPTNCPLCTPWYLHVYAHTQTHTKFKK